MQIKNTYLAFAVLAGFGLALSACGGGSDDPPEMAMPDPEPTAQEICEGADGRFNDDGTCTSAAELAAEAEEAAEAERMALADAQDAAMAAYHAARDALAGIAGQGSADPASYQRAMNALDDAKAANTAAQAATTSADAEMYQADAEAAQAVAMAQVALVIAAYEAPALASAQAAAMTAADAAKMAADAAADAVEAQEANMDADADSFASAQEAADAASAAYMAAKVASDAAAATSNLADAQMHQATAEAELAKAMAANDDAMMYAGMVQTAHEQMIANAAEAERMALADAQGAAQSAYDAAKAAVDAAAARVAALEDKKADDIQNHVRASDALVRAQIALAAAMAANDMAQAAETSTDAETYQAMAEARRDEALTQAAGANMYAGLVEASYDVAEADRQAAIQEAEDLQTAKDAAAAAATAARTAATQAREQADKVAELLGPDAEASVAAALDAAAAETAATAAEAASMAAAGAETSAEAQMHQATAEGQQGTAETELAEATELAREAGVATAALDQLRIENARDDAKAASDAAAKHAMTAREAANEARTKANDASDEAARALRARTNYPEADTAAAEAAQAASDAEAAADAAQAAADAAQAEYVKTTAADVSVDDARAARDEARNQRDAAMTSNTEAGEQQMAAMDALADTMEAANEHVLQLLIMANADHIRMALDPDANLDADELALITRNANLHRAEVNKAVADAADDTGSTAGTDDRNSQLLAAVAATWPHANPDDTTTTSTETTPRDGQLTVTVSLGGTPVPSTRDDATTPAINEATFREAHGGGLGAFPHGFEIWEETDDGAAPPVRTGGTRILVFTDKEQASAPVDAKSVSLTNEPVPNVGSRVMPGTIASPPSGLTATPAGPGENHHDFTGTFDHDDDDATDPIPGVFDCVDPTVCRVQRSGTANDGSHQEGTTVTSISGYRFSGTGTTAAVLAMEDNSWLSFGIWLRETVAPGVDTYQFGAFAGGGSAYDESGGNNGGAAPVADIVGTATYKGDAAGIHATASRMDFFSAKATLEANFGAATATGNGTIVGTIHDIVSGGVAMDDVIHMELNDADATADNASNISDGGVFTGRTRLGPATQRLDREFDYEFEGTWQGEFFNQVADDTTTTPLDESTLAPGSVAGTFGVTKDDDTTTMGVDEQESYVGAFGAHKAE